MSLWYGELKRTGIRRSWILKRSEISDLFRSVLECSIKVWQCMKRISFLETSWLRFSIFRGRYCSRFFVKQFHVTSPVEVPSIIPPIFLLGRSFRILQFSQYLRKGEASLFPSGRLLFALDPYTWFVSNLRYWTTASLCLYLGSLRELLKRGSWMQCVCFLVENPGCPFEIRDVILNMKARFLGLSGQPEMSFKREVQAREVASWYLTTFQ